MDKEKLEEWWGYVGYFIAGILIGILLLNSCRKEEVTPPNEVMDDNIVQFDEDSVINEVGCYYPITTPN